MELTEQTFNDNSVYHKVDSDCAYFADIADMHIGNMLSNKKRINEIIDIVSSIDNFYVMIGGDSTDNSSTSSASSIFEERSHGGDQILECRDLLEPIKDRILCVRSGNHGYSRSMKFNKLIPEQVLAEFLGVPFLTGCATVFMGVGQFLYVISSWHNSKSPKNMEWLHTDVTFYEHLHKHGFTPEIVMEPNKYTRKWVAKEHYDIQSGSFMNWGGYAAEKGYRPTPMKLPVIKLDGTNRVVTPFYDISIVKNMASNNQ